MIDFTTLCRFKFELQLSKTGAIFDADFDVLPELRTFQSCSKQITRTVQNDRIDVLNLNKTKSVQS